MAGVEREREFYIHWGLKDPLGVGSSVGDCICPSKPDHHATRLSAKSGIEMSSSLVTRHILMVNSVHMDRFHACIRLQLAIVRVVATLEHEWHSDIIIQT